MNKADESPFTFLNVPFLTKKAPSLFVVTSIQLLEVSAKATCVAKRADKLSKVIFLTICAIPFI
nr:MAG TPA: hypothetical protein [Caudoviricetes sp.]